MSAPLTVCWKCRRHIRDTERRCPFCASSRTGLLVTAALGATVALAACSPAGSPVTPNSPEPITPASTEAAVVPSPPAPLAAPTPSETAAPPAPPAPPATTAASTPPTTDVGPSGAYGPPPQPGIGFGSGVGAYGPPPGGFPSDSSAWVQAGRFAVQGALPEAVVQRIVRQSSGRLRSCYAAGLRDQPTATSWTAKVHFKITELGRVFGAQVDGAQIPGPEARQCLLATTNSMQFPTPPRGSPMVDVQYELTFAPAPQKPPPPRF